MQIEKIIRYEKRDPFTRKLEKPVRQIDKALASRQNRQPPVAGINHADKIRDIHINAFLDDDTVNLGQDISSSARVLL